METHVWTHSDIDLNTHNHQHVSVTKVENWTQIKQTLFSTAEHYDEQETGGKYLAKVQVGYFRCHKDLHKVQVHGAVLTTECTCLCQLLSSVLKWCNVILSARQMEARGTIVLVECFLTLANALCETHTHTHFYSPLSCWTHPSEMGLSMQSTCNSLKLRVYFNV